METIRTPDERFEALPGFDFTPNYVTIDDGEGGTLRVHHLDEGPADGPIVLLLHGEPSWSFLYRHMIPVLTGRGFRCIAPDLVGFGRSDKPTQQSDYTYARHVAWASAHLFDALGLTDITLVCQDWGGLIGLRLVAEAPERFARVVVANTGLPDGTQRLSDALVAWQNFAATTEDFPVGFIVNGGCTTDLDAAVIAAYDAPFHEDAAKAGARIFPSLIPTSPDMPGAAENADAWEVLRLFDRPFLTAFSDGDPITAGADAVFQREVPGAVGQPHTTIVGGGHFLQEDRGTELATVVADFIEGA